MAAESARDRLRELSDFATPWAVSVAATLRLADLIEDGATSVDALAAAAGAEPDALRRLLDYLVALGVFARAADGYANNEVSLLLRDELGWRPWLDLDSVPAVWAESWSGLLTAVRTGSPGRDESWFYEELERTGHGESFDAQMAVEAASNGPSLAEQYDWSGVRHLVDVGGGTGVLAATILDAHPQLQATVFDQPQVVAHAVEHERLDFVAGDIFADALPRGDAYVLSRVLHGWPDDRAGEVLARCVESGGDGVRILVVDGLLSDPPAAREASFDLFMLTLVGGRQRTLDDFLRLGASCGLVLGRTFPLPSGSSLVELTHSGDR